jgi:hypothetical protein
MLIKGKATDPYKVEYCCGSGHVSVQVHERAPRFFGLAEGWKVVHTRTVTGGEKYADQALEEFKEAVRDYEKQNDLKLRHRAMEGVVHQAYPLQPPPKKP